MAFVGRWAYGSTDSELLPSLVDFSNATAYSSRCLPLRRYSPQTSVDEEYVFPCKEIIREPGGTWQKRSVEMYCKWFNSVPVAGGSDSEKICRDHLEQFLKELPMEHTVQKIQREPNSHCISGARLFQADVVLTILCSISIPDSLANFFMSGIWVSKFSSKGHSLA